MMIPIRHAVLTAALALAAVPSAAQTLPGAFTTPVGEFEYRWQVRVHPDGRVERTPAGGYLPVAQMHEHTSAVRVTRGSGARYFTFSWGRETPGLIPPDTYRVHCDIAGEEMPLEGTFQVT
jgi:hypothetical protein